MHLTEKEPEFGRRGRQILGAAGLAALLQGGVVLGVTQLEPHVPTPAPQRITMQVVTRAPKPPVPKVEALPSPPVEVAAAPKPKRKAKNKPKAQPAPMPMAAEAPPPVKAAPPPPLVVGLTLSSTTANGKGPRFAVGNTLMGTPDAVAKKPVVGPMVRAPIVPMPSGDLEPARKVRVAAKLRHSTPPYYPPAAKRDGLEGVVVLSITIDPQGQVSKAKILRGLSTLLDESAVAAAKNTLWSPATLNGHPVRITRRFNVRFTLQS